MTTLKALLLSDRRPGHYRLAEGIVAAISRKRPVETTWLDVRRPGWVPGRVLSGAVNGGMAPARILSSVYGVEASSLGRADVVVSAGGDTLAANICASAILGASNIFYGSLRRYRLADFSLVLTSYAAQVSGGNHLMTLKPSAVDPDSFRGATGGLGSPGSLDVAGLIIGGNAGTVRYGQGDWEALFGFMGACFERFGTRWVVSNSARTPEAVSQRIAELASDGAGSSIQSFIDVRDAGAPSLSALFSQVEAVACTGDSSSMLSECVWARKPVVAVVPRDFSLPDNERGYRQWLSGQGWASEMPISSLSPETFLAGLSALTPLAGNPLDRLADDLERKLPQLFG